MSQKLGDPGTFEIRSVRFLGGGGLGMVDEVEVIQSFQSHPVGTRLARKRLNEKFRAHLTEQERFEREISALKTMSHPSIVTCAGENLPGGERYYVMPVYPRSLRNLLEANPNGYAWTDTVAFATTIASALAYAHRLGFVHRDLKPENILLDANNNPVIADWGVGAFIHQKSKVLQQLTKAGLGTEYYCSLEQWATGTADQRGDVYSLGMLLAELIMGRKLTIKQGFGILVDIVPATSVGAQSMNRLLRSMTHMLAEQRTPSMPDVITALAAANTLAMVAAGARPW